MVGFWGGAQSRPPPPAAIVRGKCAQSPRDDTVAVSRVH
eukprot:CAMPEP_0170248556 /NCGR_PEP_ID=MMETSP0116_2-20130129/24073_1 /TAXON_ID=400756 /ORGANISM="Durinskia baltica, Strain CSIRO CS-38" /LENGTH=38 /DNA_ID= /DNA_START= /DNA_END= /DNA_ORIENTATION=